MLEVWTRNPEHFLDIRFWSIHYYSLVAHFRSTQWSKRTFRRPKKFTFSYDSGEPTGPEEKNRVHVSCPVPPGTVFYGVVPAPLPLQSSDPNAARSQESRQLCARLVSAADECLPGESGYPDRMKYTVSDCAEQQITPDGSLPPEVVAVPKSENVFEG